MAVFIRSPLEPCSNGASALEAEEELLYRLEDVTCSVARLDAEEGREVEDWGLGSLRVTSRRVLWQRGEAPPEGSDDAMAGFGMRAKHMGLHAVTRDPETFPRPCLYAQLLLDDFPVDGDHPTELFFAPADDSKLQELFEVFRRRGVVLRGRRVAHARLRTAVGLFSDGDPEPRLGRRRRRRRRRHDHHGRRRRDDGSIPESPQPTQTQE